MGVIHLHTGAGLVVRGGDVAERDQPIGEDGQPARVGFELVVAAHCDCGNCRSRAGGSVVPAIIQPGAAPTVGVIDQVVSRDGAVRMDFKSVAAVLGEDVSICEGHRGRDGTRCVVQVGSIARVADGIHVRQCDGALGINFEAVIPVRVELYGANQCKGRRGTGVVVFEIGSVARCVTVGGDIVDRDGTIAPYVQAVIPVAIELVGSGQRDYACGVDALVIGIIIIQRSTRARSG